MDSITYDVQKDFGSIGGKKKLTLTSWNGNTARYDIRDWYDDGKTGKGITLDKHELSNLYEILKVMEKVFPEEVLQTVETSEPVICAECKYTGKFKHLKDGTHLTCELKDNKVIYGSKPKWCPLVELKSEEETPETESKFPTEIEKVFEVLDTIFKDFEVDNKYEKMPFADNVRIQYYVKKSDKEFPAFENMINDLGLKWFVTNKGNMFIYSL